MKHAQGKGPLNSRHLILVKFHGIDGPTAIRVVLGKGPEYAGQQDSGLGAFGMDGIWCLQFFISLDVMDTIYLLDMEIRYREIIVKDRLIYLFYKSITFQRYENITFIFLNFLIKS